MAAAPIKKHVYMHIKIAIEGNIQTYIHTHMEHDTRPSMLGTFIKINDSNVSVVAM